MDKTSEKEIDILFVIPPYHRRNGSGSLFPLGIGSIMASLDKKCMTYDYIDCTQIIDTLWPEDLLKLEDKLTLKIAGYRTSLVGIGPCVTPGARALKVVAKCCLDVFGKEKVFAGGPFTLLSTQDWFFYEELGLTYLIKGDGEEAIAKAIETIRKGESLKQCDAVSYYGCSVINRVDDLDSLPFPKRVQMEKNIFSDRRKADSETNKTIHIVASRGCPYHCDYCVSGNLGGPFRKRSHDNIVSEMKMLADVYGVTDIVFYDDCFFTSVKTVHKEIQSFCDALQQKKLDMTWQIEIRPDILVEIFDDELKMLSINGCRQMNIGVEKTYKEGASTLGKRYNYEKLKAYLFHAHQICSIRMTGTFILGGEKETIESTRKLIRASIDMGLDDAEYSPLFVYPDTPLYDKYFKNPKEWFSVVLNATEPWGEVVYENNKLRKEDLISLIDEAYQDFYQSRAMIKHVKDRYRLKGEKNEKCN